MTRSSGLQIACSNGTDAVLRFAAEELQRYVDLASGIDAGIVPGPQAAAITVELSVEQPTDTPNGDAFRIGFERGRVQLVSGSSRGVLYAVYAFLEEYLGFRWYVPGNDVVPTYAPGSLVDLLRDLVKAGARKRWKPDFRIRMLRFLVYELGPAETPIADAAMRAMRAEVDWMAKNRMNVFQFALDHHDECPTHWPGYRALFPEFRKRGIRLGAGGHMTFMLMRPELFNENPDWFALRDGRRTTDGMFCTRNDEALRHYLGEIERFLDENPEMEYFAPWPSDVLGWCECERCRDSSPTDRHLELSHRTHALISERFPHVEFTHFAYAAHLDPPRRERLEPGVSVTVCTWGRDYAVPFNNERTKPEFRSALQRWGELAGETGVPLIIHEKYARHLGFGPHLLPVPVLSQDVRFFRSLSADGFELPMAFMGRWVKGLNAYVLSRLLWDTDASVDGIANDFFEHYYGPFADVARRACELSEEATPDWRYWHFNAIQAGLKVKPGEALPEGLKEYCDAAMAGLARAVDGLRRAGVGSPEGEQSPQLQKLLQVLEYALLEWRGLHALIRGAGLLLAAGSKPRGIERQQVLSQAIYAFQRADHFDRERQAQAANPDLLDVTWDATASGPHGVYRPGAPQEWLTYVDAQSSRAT